MVLSLTSPTLLFMPWVACTNKSATYYGRTNFSNCSHSAPAAPKVHATKALPKDSHVITTSSKEEHIYDIFGRKLGHDDDGLVYQQNFSIRSYDVGPDGKATVASLMKRLQETAIHHSRRAGFFAGGLGYTRGMSKMDLVWVFRKLHIVVEKDYPSWDDVIQVESWLSASGDSGLFGNWIVRDYNGEIILRAASFYVMMNMHTRKYTKFTAEIKDEIKPFLVNSVPFTDINNKNPRKLDIDNPRNYVRTGLTPGWSDLDVNQHVSNTKYVDWVSESVPLPILESHQLSSMVLEFRRECTRGSVVQSHTAVARCRILGHSRHDDEELEFDHVLRLQTGSDILRGNTKWKPKAHFES